MVVSTQILEHSDSFYGEGASMLVHMTIPDYLAHTAANSRRIGSCQYLFDPSPGKPLQSVEKQPRKPYNTLSRRFFKFDGPEPAIFRCTSCIRVDAVDWVKGVWGVHRKDWEIAPRESYSSVTAGLQAQAGLHMVTAFRTTAFRIH